VDKLTPITALGHTAPQIDTIGTITITEQPDIALASISARLCRDTETCNLLAKLIGTDAPGPGKSATGRDYVLFWSGPEQWMLTVPSASHQNLAEELDAMMKGAASVTEQSGAWVQFHIAGTARLDMMEQLCALPSRTMRKGDANRTRIQQMGCFVLCLGKAFAIIGPRSSAKSLHHALTTTAHSVA